MNIAVTDAEPLGRLIDMLGDCNIVHCFDDYLLQTLVAQTAYPNSPTEMATPDEDWKISMYYTGEGEV